MASNGQTNAAMSQHADLQVTRKTSTISILRLLMVYASSVHFTCVAALRLVEDGMQTVSDIYSVQNGEGVNLECFGPGMLRWTRSTGLEIPTDNTANIYQSYDESRDALALTIRSFSRDATATYTCTTDLAVNGPITASVLITSCECNPSNKGMGRERSEESSWKRRDGERRWGWGGGKEGRRMRMRVKRRGGTEKEV